LREFKSLFELFMPYIIEAAFGITLGHIIVKIKEHFVIKKYGYYKRFS